MPRKDAQISEFGIAFYKAQEFKAKQSSWDAVPHYHAVPGVAGIYDLIDMRAALEKWAQHLASIVASGYY